MTGVSLERLAETLYPKQEPKNGTAYGTVESVNADGSYQVKLNASATTTRCAKLCDAGVGDRVLVLIQANGHCAAIGRVGGTDLSWVMPKTTVLYNSSTGTTGTVALSQSAANFDHMRIYTMKTNDSKQVSSVDVYKPNGKTAFLWLGNPASNVQYTTCKLVSISGTSITNGTQNEGAYGAYGTFSGSSSIAIYRVEAWNEGN